MHQFTQEQRDDLKKIVLDYLVHGSDLDNVGWLLKNRSTKYKNNFSSCKKLFQAVPISVKEALDDPLIIAILASTEDPDGDKNARLRRKLLNKSRNLFELLTNIYHRGNHQLGHLLKLIESTYPQRNWTLSFILGAFLTAGFAGVFYFKPEYGDNILSWLRQTFPTVLKWIGKTFSLLKNIPLLGVAWHAAFLIGDWIYTFKKGTATFKLNRLLFNTLNAGFIITAYSLTYLAMGIMTAPAAILLILGSGTIDVLGSAFNLWYVPKPIPLSKEQKESWKHVAAYERANNLYRQLWRSFWVKLGAAILITAAVILWYSLPPTLILSLSCLVFGWLVTLARVSILRTSKIEHAQKLQASIHAIEVRKTPDLVPCVTYEQKELAKQVAKQKEQIERLEKKLLSKNAKLQALRKQRNDENGHSSNESEEDSHAKMRRHLGPYPQTRTPPAIKMRETPSESDIIDEEGYRSDPGPTHEKKPDVYVPRLTQGIQ
jgi:hypothetical protein